jgi:hypothetical protein
MPAKAGIQTSRTDCNPVESGAVGAVHSPSVDGRPWGRPLDRAGRAPKGVRNLRWIPRLQAYETIGSGAPRLSPPRKRGSRVRLGLWIPACAGMTRRDSSENASWAACSGDRARRGLLQASRCRARRRLGAPPAALRDDPNRCPAPVEFLAQLEAFFRGGCDIRWRNETRVHLTLLDAEGL